MEESGAWLTVGHLRVYVLYILHVPEDAVGVGVFLGEEHATNDEAREQPAHVHEVIYERREADAYLLGVRAGAGAEGRAGFRVRVWAGARAGVWGWS